MSVMKTIVINIVDLDHFRLESQTKLMKPLVFWERRKLCLLTVVSETCFRMPKGKLLYLVYLFSVYILAHNSVCTALVTIRAQHPRSMFTHQ